MPGGNNLRHVLEASRPYLEDKDEPVIAYLPLASLYSEKWLGVNREAFDGLGELVEINAELMTQREIENVIRDAALVYITGGNTFLLNHRLHASGVMPYLKKKVQNGLPIVGVSAGMILCGPNILTSRDMNTVETNYFGGLSALPLTFCPIIQRMPSASRCWMTGWGIIISSTTTRSSWYVMMDTLKWTAGKHPWRAERLTSCARTRRRNDWLKGK